MSLFQKPVFVLVSLCSVASLAAFWVHVGSVAEGLRSAPNPQLALPQEAAQNSGKRETAAAARKAKKAALLTAAAAPLAARVAQLESQPQLSLYAAECAMTAWAACDPAAAGDWLNTHKSSPHFAAFARAYAVQAAVNDPAAARQWAALAGSFPRQPSNVLEAGYYGPVEHTIRAIEHMMSGSSPESPGQANVRMTPIAEGGHAAMAWAVPGRAPLLDEYVPVLVRMAAGAEPVIMMKPLDPLACHPCHQGTWQVPVQVMVIDANGSIIPESTIAAAGSR